MAEARGGADIVAIRDDGHPQAEIERPPRGRDAKGNLGRLRLFDIWRNPDPVEARKQRQARRLALLLLAASSVASLLILYGVWIMLR